jgi:prolyl-tRNA editing enzyme YbaK/EbsC (Cys-tRNA(Pro) deacylase)
MVQASASQRVAETARNLGLEIEVREFSEGTRTAQDAANAIGVSVGQIVKSLVFLADGAPIVCLVSGANRVDTDRLAQAIGATRIDRADADTAREATGFSIGGVPPFAHATDIAVYCDRDLLAHDVIWSAAGTPTAVFSAGPQALVDACGAEIVDLKETR